MLNMMLPPKDSNKISQENIKIKQKPELKRFEEQVRWKPLNTMEFSLKNLPIFAK
jgi:hypothetical protein